MTIQQIDERIQELWGLVARGQHVGGVYQEQGAAVAKCMPVIQELRAMMQDHWQPIETAPKDGTRIITGRVGCECHCSYFHQTHKEWWAEYADGPGWQPTHWKPMPERMTSARRIQTTSLLDAILTESPQEVM